MICLVMPAHAADFYLQSNMPVGDDWNDSASWFDQTSGGGNNPTVFGSNDFFLNGFSLRTASGGSGSSTFNGGSLNFADSGDILDLMIPTANINNTVSVSNGAIRVHSSRDAVSLTIGTLDVSGTNFSFRAPNANDEINLDITTLTGSGDLNFGNLTAPDSGIGFSLDATTTTGFTGRLLPDDGTLTFNSGDYSAATLFVDTANGSFVELATSVSVAALEGSFGSIGAGTYTASELNTLTSSSSFTGANTLTVIPEPSSSTFALMAVAGLSIALARRRAS
jgi:hypothetical protein